LPWTLVTQGEVTSAMSDDSPPSFTPFPHFIPTPSLHTVTLWNPLDLGTHTCAGSPEKSTQIHTGTSWTGVAGGGAGLRSCGEGVRELPVLWAGLERRMARQTL
jgi:hypothetical protein